MSERTESQNRNGVAVNSASAGVTSRKVESQVDERSLVLKLGEDASHSIRGH